MLDKLINELKSDDAILKGAIEENNLVNICKSLSMSMSKLLVVKIVEAGHSVPRQKNLDSLGKMAGLRLTRREAQGLAYLRDGNFDLGNGKLPKSVKDIQNLYTSLVSNYIK